ncbi:MAG: hypothetical protein ACLUD0_21160 [Eubacterium ramulus]
MKDRNRGTGDHAETGRGKHNRLLVTHRRDAVLMMLWAGKPLISVVSGHDFRDLEMLLAAEPGTVVSIFIPTEVSLAGAWLRGVEKMARIWWEIGGSMAGCSRSSSTIFRAVF